MIRILSNRKENLGDFIQWHISHYYQQAFFVDWPNERETEKFIQITIIFIYAMVLFTLLHIYISQEI